MNNNKNTYISTVYNSKDRPITSYPLKLCNYLINKYAISEKSKILEVGVGRGDFLIAFNNLGHDTYGTDISNESIDLLSELRIKICDVENKQLPYVDNFFDVIFNKSLIEHLHNPKNFLQEALRVLKPGGIIITMVPDWESNYKIYFDDFTHVTPYTKYSLYDAYKMYGFSDVRTSLFRQLPILWKYPFLNIVAWLISFFSPIRSKYKFLRWSRELMVVGVAKKPILED